MWGMALKGRIAAAWVPSVVVLLATTGCSSSETRTSAPAAPPFSSSSNNGGSLPAPTPPAASAIPTSAPGMPRPSVLPVAVPSASPDAVVPTDNRSLREGDRSPVVLAAQRRLSALGYWLGTPDGHFGDLTRQAVYALQKAAGLSRDGVIGSTTWAALVAGVRPQVPGAATGDRIVVDKARQLLLIVDGGKLTSIINASTGSGQYYRQGGQRHLAITPSGTFSVFRQVNHEDVGPLGPLWRPKYFNQGIAVHGSNSVPPYPASHGCIRVSNAAMDWIWASGAMPIGASVSVA
jgi:peptidoglycan hydrolase-like protein with peptidoglycan-binding domain